MNNLLRTIWRYIGDIFIEKWSWQFFDFQFQVRDLTQHYKSDFPTISIDKIYVIADYSIIHEDIEAYKYRSDRSKARKFVELFVKVFDTIWSKIDDECITTIPMHWSRYFIRGFNHMDYILNILTQKVSIPYIQPFKTSFSRRQSRLSREKRFENRRNHFTIDTSYPLPQKVYLIDDVISTGATANECAKLLKEKGVKEVIWVFLASTAEL